MNGAITFRHVVSIAGVVRDKANKARLANALVEIIEGPPAFQAIVNACKANPAWQNRRDRIDRTWSQADGIFTFVDLPPGANYRLRISIPSLGTQYGTVEIDALEVKQPMEYQPIPVTRADVALPPTRIHGVVTDQATSEPLAGARARLYGDTQIVVTTDNGVYELTRLVKGAPTLEVTAAKFVTVVKKVELAAGQDRIEDIQLQPI